jgi:hypothetical protein
VDRLGGPGCMGSRSIGLDIDRGALKAVQVSRKAVQVSRSADAYTLRHIGYHRLPPGAIAEGEVADADLLATEIREFWSSHSFKGKSVILGVAHARVAVRLLDFPRMEEEDLERALAPRTRTPTATASWTTGTRRRAPAEAAKAAAGAVRATVAVQGVAGETAGARTVPSLIAAE